MYADETVLLSESANDLQHALDVFSDYCDVWKLHVNTTKTKVLIFSKGRVKKELFTYKNSVIENVKDFCYLGILLSRSGKYTRAKARFSEQATKALYGVIRKLRHFNLPIDCQLDLFDKVIQPVLLYSCEIWGYEQLEVIEKVHLRFLKFILNLKSSTPNSMIYGETGRFPLSITVKTRMITYWTKVLTAPDNKLVKVYYQYFHNCYRNGSYKHPWLKYIEDILNSCGLSFVWASQNFLNINWIKTIVKDTLESQFIQEWHSSVENSSKCTNYRILKTTFGFEDYLTKLPKDLRNKMLL